MFVAKRLFSLSITPRAQDKIISLIKTGGGGGEIEGKKKFLRLMVDSGGCHGFKYEFKLDSVMDTKDDFQVPGSSLVIDSISLPFLEGSVVDWIDEPIKSSFRVIGNSNSMTKGCGCGISFGLLGS